MEADYFRKVRQNKIFLADDFFKEIQKQYDNQSPKKQSSGSMIQEVNQLSISPAHSTGTHSPKKKYFVKVREHQLINSNQFMEELQQQMFPQIIVPNTPQFKKNIMQQIYENDIENAKELFFNKQRQRENSVDYFSDHTLTPFKDAFGYNSDNSIPTPFNILKTNCQTKKKLSTDLTEDIANTDIASTAKRQQEKSTFSLFHSQRALKFE